MKLQELNILELECRFEMSLTAESPCVDPETYAIDLATAQEIPALLAYKGELYPLQVN